MKQKIGSLIKNPELAFISMPLRAATPEGYQANLANARWITKLIIEMEYIPITPHLQYLGVLNINDTHDDSKAVRLCVDTLKQVRTAFFCLPQSMVLVESNGTFNPMSFSSGMKYEWETLMSITAEQDRAVTFTIAVNKGPQEAFVIVRVEYRFATDPRHEFSSRNLAAYKSKLDQVEDMSALWEDENLINHEFKVGYYDIRDKAKGVTEELEGVVRAIDPDAVPVDRLGYLNGPEGPPGENPHIPADYEERVATLQPRTILVSRAHEVTELSGSELTAPEPGPEPGAVALGARMRAWRDYAAEETRLLRENARRYSMRIMSEEDWQRTREAAINPAHIENEVGNDAE